MSAQNIVSLGLDVTSFSEEKKTLLSEYIGLFEKLEKYDGLKVNPIMGEGLTSFNDAISKTNVLLDEMKVKMGELASVQAASVQSSKAAANSKREESTELNNYSKMVADAEKLRMKLAAATSDEAKELMALKLQLSEVTKQMLEEAKASRESTVAKQNQIQAERDLNDERMRVVAVLEQQHVANLQAEKDNLTAQKLEEKEATRQLRLEEEALNVQAKEFEINERTKKRALDEEAKSAQALTQDYRILRQALSDQKNAYSLAYNTHGKDSNEAKQALAQYGATAGIVTDIDKNLKNATGTSKLFGGALSSAFSQLRMIAYILPGIGIAGIFNLAYEALAKAADEAGIFNNRLEQYLQYETAINKSLDDQILLNQKLYTLQKELNDTTAENVAHKRVTEVDESKGIDAVTLAERKFSQAGQDVIKGDIENIFRGNATETFKKDLERRLEEITKFTKEAEALQKRIDDALNPNRSAERNAAHRALGATQNLPSGGLGVVNIGQNADPKKLKEEKDSLDAHLKVLQDTYNIDKVSYEKMLQLNLDFFKTRAALQKILADEERKFHVETTKNDIAVEIEKNNKILSNERSTEEERLRSIKNIEAATKRLNDITLFNVKDNPTSTSRDKDIADNKNADDNAKAHLKSQQDTERVLTEFYQRHIKAVKDVQKDELDATAIAQEKIANNEKNSLEDRIAAYNKYIMARQKMQVLEEEVALQRGASHAGGKTSLTDEEKLQIEQAAATQRANIQADAEKKIYDIVSSSAASQFKIIKEANEHQSLESEISETNDLHRINEALRKKQISYKNYYAEREIIEKKYRTRNLEEAIQDDLLDLSRTTELEDKQKGDLSNSNKSLFTKKVALDQNPTLENQKAYDEELGANKAYSDAVVKTDQERLTIEAKLIKDRLNLEKTALDDELKARKEAADLILEIEEALYNLIKTAIDANYQRRLDHLEMTKQVVDEQYGYEIAAIEKSTLSAKDKAALDIQLKEQQREYDKKAAIEERKLKHDQAVADKELTIAHILWTTEEAVMNALALKLPPPLPETIAIERGALGAIAVATVLAEGVPSYAEGTENHPGGWARFGEAGTELVKEPYRQPYYAFEETIRKLPRGTEIIPIQDSPEFSETKKDDGWEQTRWLAKQMKKNNKPVNNTFNPVINIDLGYESYKRKIIGN